MLVLTIQKRTLSVEEAAQYLGVGRSVAYEQVRTGAIPSIKIGKRYLIPVAALERLLESGGQGEVVGQST